MSEITPKRESAITTPGGIDFQTLFSQALDKGQDPSQIVALFERMEDRAKDAERKDAIAQAKAQFTPVGRTHATNHTKLNRDGSIKSGGYARLEDIQEMVDPIFAPLGLDYRWGYETDERGKSWLVFYVTHRNGTEEERSRTEYEPDKSGSKSANQARSAGETYAMRGTMRMGLSIRFTDDCSEDNDGADMRGPAVAGDELNDQQYAELDTLYAQLDKDTQERFLKWLHVSKLGEVPSSRYGEAKYELGRKVRAIKK